VRGGSAEEFSDARAEHRAAGNVLVGLGGMGASIGLVAFARDITLRFIDAPTMLALGIAMACLGLWQRRAYH
jgi:hypothetical protein